MRELTVDELFRIFADEVYSRHTFAVRPPIGLFTPIVGSVALRLSIGSLRRVARAASYLRMPRLAAGATNDTAGQGGVPAVSDQSQSYARAPTDLSVIVGEGVQDATTAQFPVNGDPEPKLEPPAGTDPADGRRPTEAPATQAWEIGRRASADIGGASMDDAAVTRAPAADGLSAAAIAGVLGEVGAEQRPVTLVHRHAPVHSDEGTTASPGSVSRRFYAERAGEAPADLVSKRRSAAGEYGLVGGSLLSFAGHDSGQEYGAGGATAGLPSESSDLGRSGAPVRCLDEWDETGFAERMSRAMCKRLRREREMRGDG